MYLRVLGHVSNQPSGHQAVEWFRGIGECKIDWGPGLRIYLVKDGLKVIILIGGGTKKHQQRDIDQAMASQSGNPTMSNISAVFAAIKRALKVEMHTHVVTA